MLILGVDPGASGALVLVDTASRKIIDLLDVPTLAMGGWRLVDGTTVSAWLQSISFDLAVLEKVDARPTDGRGSIAQFARNAGGLGALLTATGKPLVLTTPRTWKERAGLLDQPKRASIQLARLLFGATAADLWFKLQKHDGRAEAALIALYGGGPP